MSENIKFNTPLGIFDMATRMFEGATPLPEKVCERLRVSIKQYTGADVNFEVDWKPQRLKGGSVVYKPIAAIQSFLRCTAKAEELYPEAYYHLG